MGTIFTSSRARQVVMARSLKHILMIFQQDEAASPHEVSAVLNRRALF